MRKLCTFLALLVCVACSGNHSSSLPSTSIPSPTLSPLRHHQTASPTPSAKPTATPTAKPTAAPTVKPTATPTIKPTAAPTVKPTATPTPAPTISAPAHVITADYWLNTTNQAQYAPYLTMEYSSSAYISAVKAAGIKTVEYEDFSMPNGKDLDATLESQYPNAFAKDCSGNYVTTYSGTGRLLDPHGSQALAFMQAAINLHSSRNPDMIFEDNFNDLYGANVKPCDFTTYADWMTKLDSLVSQLNRHGAAMYVNTLNVGGQGATNQIDGLNAITISGGEHEYCYDHATSLLTWEHVENTELTVVHNNKGYWCYENGAWAANAAETVIPARTLYYASFLLTYNPKTSIYQTWLKTASNFKVMPETGFVALLPAKTALLSIAELQVGGLFERNFGYCAYRGKGIGKCEVVVNPGTTSLPVSTTFAHSVRLSGSDVLDGGSLSVAGPKVTSLAPMTGAILTP